MLFYPVHFKGILDAIKRSSRAKPVHRSVRLTPFGQDFCEVCLPPDAV